MLVKEFNVDTLPNWRDAVLAGREQWRKYQVRSVGRGWPEQAAEVLTKIGYQGTPPSSGHPMPNEDLLRDR